MKVPDLFVGRRLFVGCGNPVGLGIGPTEIRGSAYIEGPLMVGNPLTYPIAEANLMVARCINIEALPPPPSIFKVSSRGMPPTPIDVMLGDPAGHVGIAVNSTVISIFNDTNVSIISPYTTGVGILNWLGAKTLTGVVAETGAEARIGKEAVSAETVDNGVKTINGALYVASQLYVPQIIGADISQCSGKKDFDIPHPLREGWRLRHVCIEGPTADVYVRGKLKDSNVIDLPEYWRGLVDPETITINITPIGYYQELFVEKIEWGTKVIIKNNAGSSINCHYTISGERIDVEKNISEYEGTYEDYPGDNSEYMNTVRFLPMEN
jgi:hypothetical protein